jgi:hypothetical protein
MTDYYAVLKKAVSGFEAESGDARRSVYDKARSALIAQLKSIDPPLTTSEISRQRLELEEAIRKVEREASAARATPVRVSAAAAVAEALAASAPAAAQAAPEAAPVAPAEPPYVEPAPLRPAPRVAEPVRPAPIPTPPPAPAPEVEVEPEIVEPVEEEPVHHVEPEPAWPEIEAEPELVHEPIRPVLPIQPQWPQGAASKADYDEDHFGAQDRRREPRLSRDHDEPRFSRDDEIDTGPRFASDADWAPEPFDDQPAEPIIDEPRGRKARAVERDRNRRDERSSRGERKKSSRWPTLILLILIGLLLGGIAALAWSQRSVVKDVIGDLIDSAEQSGPKPTLSEDPEPAPAVTKNADRLGGAPDDAPAKSVRTVDAEPAPEDQELDPLAGVMAPEGTRPAEVAEAPAPAEAPASQSAPAADTSAATADESLVAQKAILYEQPTDGSQNVKIVPATATWKFNPNSSNGPEIQANLEVPEKGMKVTLNIRKNNDSALPASHLVEIVVDTPADFAGGGVKSVPALVMKPTEDSRGQPLDGAAAKVADGFFWIAFSNDAEPMAKNVALLRERNWIDLPIVYNNDQRAILTFEKGTPGQRVFEKAIAAWGSS